MNKYITKHLIFYLGIFLLILNCFLDKDINAICSLYCIFISIFCTYYVYKNKLLLIIFMCISYFVYSMCIYNYIDDSMISMFKEFVGTEYSKVSLNILLLFLLFILFFLPKKINDVQIKNVLSNKKYFMPFGLLLDVILFLILIMAFGRPDTLGDRGNPSALYEYSIIIFIILYYFYHNNIMLKNVTTILLVLFVLQNIIFGGRVTAIQLLFVYIIFFHIDHLSRKSIVLGSFFGIFMMSLIGAFRGNILFIDSNDIYTVFKDLFENKFLNDTSYAAYHTSITFLVAKNQVTSSQIIYYAFMYFLSIPFGSIVKDSNLAQISHKFVFHYYGGVLPFFFYFYFGLIGIFFIAFYLSKLLKMINSLKPEKGLKTCLSIYITSTVFRWFLYSPNYLLRGILIFLIVYSVIIFSLKLVRREISVKY